MPYTPGKDVVFIKSGIPSPAWGDETKEISLAVEGTVTFKGEYTYKDTEAGMTIVYNFFTDGYSIYCERAIYA